SVIARLNAAGITVLTSIKLTKSIIKSKDFADAYKTLLSVDARYIYIDADPVTTANFYYPAREHGLIDERHVWFGMGWPLPASYDIEGEFGPLAMASLQGYVVTFDSTQSESAPSLVAFNATWMDLADTSPRYAPFTFFSLFVGAYDCANTILYGMDQVLKNNPAYTPEMLASRQLKHLFNRTAFYNTGYHGLIWDPIQVDDTGGVEL
ncbi:hypothetical protein HDU76_008831, partial [Blyttiomyces sp. JEL0837]